MQNQKTYLRRISETELSLSATPAKKVKKQICYILMHEKGHPVKFKGQFMVFASRWRALAASSGKEFIVKRLEIEL